MNHMFGIAVFLVVSLCSLTNLWTNQAWQQDCERLGYSRVGDKVYSCAPVIAPVKK